MLRRLTRRGISGNLGVQTSVDRRWTKRGWRIVSRAFPVSNLAAGAILFLLLASGSIRASETVTLQVQEAGEELFLGLGNDGEPLKPEAGKCACLGRFDRFSVKDVNQITVLGADGKQLSLVIDKSSIFVEFGEKIVALRFYVLLPKDQARAGESTLELKWGADVKAVNIQVESFVLSSALRSGYRSLREAPSSSGGGGGPGSTATILVIADSSADYHFLWYLLPIGVIFALLTVRKFLLTSAPAGHEGSGGDPVSRNPR
jgi:hypothetical protein